MSALRPVSLPLWGVLLLTIGLPSGVWAQEATTLSGSASHSVQAMPVDSGIEWRPTSPQATDTNPCRQTLDQATALMRQGQVAPALMHYQQALNQATERPDYFALVQTLVAMRAYRLADAAGNAMVAQYPELAPVWQVWRTATFPPVLASAREELANLDSLYRDRLATKTSHFYPLSPTAAALPVSSRFQQLSSQFEQRELGTVISALSRPSPESNTPMGQWLLSRALWQKNQPHAAESALNAALTLAVRIYTPQEQRTFHRQLIDILLAENWLTPASQILTRHSNLYSATEAQPYELAGRLALAAGKPSDAQALLWQAAFLDSQQPRIWNALAEATSSQDPAQRLQLAHYSRTTSRYSDQVSGVQLVADAQATLTQRALAPALMPNDTSYLRHLLSAEAGYQLEMATFYKALPAQLAQPDTVARQRFVRQAFGRLSAQLQTLAGGYPPTSAPCLATRKALLAKAYEQLGILQQLAAEPDLSPNSLARLQPALKQQARLETMVITELPRLSALPPMTLYDLKQQVGLTFAQEQQVAQEITALIKVPAQKSSVQKPNIRPY